jgi:hypothetical protein
VCAEKLSGPTTRKTDGPARGAFDDRLALKETVRDGKLGGV